MKPHLLILFLTYCIPLWSIAQSDIAAANRNYGIKSCRIVYTFQNGPQSGSKIVTFDQWGAIEKEEVTTMTDTGLMRKALTDAPAPVNKMALPGVQHVLLIKDTKTKYTIDLGKMIGYVTHASALQVGPDFLEKNSIVVGNDTILGKPCVIREMHQAFRFWVWNKIVLKKKLIQNGPEINVAEYATEIDEDYVMKPDEFKVPPNIKVQ